ncbi:AraC family transcriptional regulator [Cupriavidus basilensis]|uniref:AraC family transcriptional regulator n=1 Tax=Cupriavidus basilensis TaxID=68895 RepID=A0ABT6AH87_9BURK|nr:AraC family transcriptional regulator [Cupriavidus basilensis]MDF3831968.1 AraC family transcriptional regulator [Cupriavidus basilensis]
MPQPPAATAAEPLAGALLNDPTRLVFASTDQARTRAAVGAVFKPHKLTIGGTTLAARMHHAPLGAVSFNRLAYGAEVQIEPGPLDDFLLVQMPVAGHAEIRCGEQQILSDHETASVLTPSDAVRMRWSHDSDQLIVRIERGALERICAAYLGHRPQQPLRFELGMAWRRLAAWYQLMHYLTDTLMLAPDAARHPLTACQLEQLVIGTLLTVQPHSLTQALLMRGKPLAPRHVKLVEEYIHAHAHAPLTPAALAEVAGVSLRGLYAGFREHRGISPMAYLRAVRLERVRHDLLNDRAVDSVTAAALRWGFSHLGRFSIEYRKSFGEPPGQTLRRRGPA